MPIFKKQKETAANVWAPPEMLVTFRAKIMPGKNREERTFRIKEVFSNGRVILYDFTGEHKENEFEVLNFLREKTR